MQSNFWAGSKNSDRHKHFGTCKRTRHYSLLQCDEGYSWFYPILISNTLSLSLKVFLVQCLIMKVPRQMSMSKLRFSFIFGYFVYYYDSLNSMISPHNLQASLQNNKSTAKARPCKYLVNIYRVCFYVGAPMLLAKVSHILYLDLMCKTYLNFEVFVLINNSGSVLQHSSLN